MSSRHILFINVSEEMFWFPEFTSSGLLCLIFVSFFFGEAVNVIGLVPECPCLLAYVPAVAHISTGVLTFSCFSLGKNVKHHSLDKEPSILDICFKVSKSPFSP